MLPLRVGEPSKEQPMTRGPLGDIREVWLVGKLFVLIAGTAVMQLSRTAVRA